jgi:hypothetical protein
MLGPPLFHEPAQRSTPRLVQLGGLRANGAAGSTPRLLEPHHSRAACRQACGQQLKISSADAATCAVAEDQKRARLLGKIDEQPAWPLRCGYSFHRRGHDQISVS